MSRFAWSFIAQTSLDIQRFARFIEADYREQDVAESAIVCVDLERAAFDVFLIELQQVEKEHLGAASLLTTPKHLQRRLSVTCPGIRKGPIVRQEGAF